MKITTIKLLCITLLLCSLFSLYGCCCCLPNGDLQEKLTGNSIDGTYYLHEVVYEGTSFNQEQMENLGISTNDCYIRLNSNNTGMMRYNGESFSVCWNDSQIWPEGEPDESINYTISGKLLTLDIDGILLVLKKK